MYQRQFTITVNGEKIVISRVTKKTAENRYNNGAAIYVYPVNVNPESPWFSAAGFTKNDQERSFQALVNEYSFYNCNYNELGKYPAYYVKKEG